MKNLSRLLLCALVMQAAGMFISDAEARSRSRARAATSRGGARAGGNSTRGTSTNTVTTPEMCESYAQQYGWYRMTACENVSDVEANAKCESCRSIGHIFRSSDPYSPLESKCRTGMQHGWTFANKCLISVKVVGGDGIIKDSQQTDILRFNCNAPEGGYCLYGNIRLERCQGIEFSDNTPHNGEFNPWENYAINSNGCAATTSGETTRAAGDGDAKSADDKDSGKNRGKAAGIGAAVGAGTGILTSVAKDILSGNAKGNIGKVIGNAALAGGTGAAVGAATGGISGNALAGGLVGGAAGVGMGFGANKITTGIGNLINKNK